MHTFVAKYSTVSYTYSTVPLQICKKNRKEISTYILDLRKTNLIMYNGRQHAKLSNIK